MMPIRFANTDDVPGMVALGQRMHAITRFKHFTFDGERLAQALRAALTDGKNRYTFFVAIDSQGKLVGVLLAVLEQHIFSSQLTASIMHYDVLPESRMGGWGVRLLRAFELWARNRQIFEISFGINSGAEQESVGRFAQKMGFEKVGENFVKELG